jgi:hypothetical protein
LAPSLRGAVNRKRHVCVFDDATRLLARGMLQLTVAGFRSAVCVPKCAPARAGYDNQDPTTRALPRAVIKVGGPRRGLRRENRAARSSANIEAPLARRSASSISIGDRSARADGARIVCEQGDTAGLRALGPPPSVRIAVCPTPPSRRVQSTQDGYTAAPCVRPARSSAGAPINPVSSATRR